MTLTEEEARAKWCPEVRWVENTNELTLNRPGKWATERCIASDCMAFRWMPDVTATLSGNIIRVDTRDADLLNGCWWDGRYARKDEGRLHRLITARAYGALPSDVFVDHIDGDTCNNRRGNLRLASKAQNAANAGARGGASRFRGVHPTRSGRWCAQIKSGDVRQTLGTFDTEEEAAAAYDSAAAKMHGAFARPNLEERANVGRVGYCGKAGKP